MPRADLIVNLVRAGTQGDQRTFRSTVEAIAAEERAKRHTQLAERPEENLRQPATAAKESSKNNLNTYLVRPVAGGLAR